MRNPGTGAAPPARMLRGVRLTGGRGACDLIRRTSAQTRPGPPPSERPRMNAFIHGMVRAVAATFDLPGPVLEVGSYQVEGQRPLSDLRPLFPGRAYVGLDARPGPGVDLVGDVEDLPQPDASVGTVLAVCTFEHVPRFWN